MSFYNFDIKTALNELLPPDKRKPGNKSLGQALVSPLQWARDMLFGTYYEGNSTTIGVKERILYNGCKMVLEYALNKKFDPTLQRITLTNLASVKDGFMIGATEAYSSSIGQTTSSDAIGSQWTWVYLKHFQINVPTAIISTFNTDQIRGYADTLIPASLKYNIVTF